MTSDPNVPNNDPWLTTKQVAAQLQMNPQTIRIWLEEGHLVGVRPGSRRWLVRQSEVDRLLHRDDSPRPDAQPTVPAGSPAPARAASLQAGEQIILPDSVG